MTLIDLAMGIGLGQGVESLSRLIASSFVSGLWQGIVLAAAAALCLRLVPRTTAAVRFAIWTAVFAVLAMLPLVHASGLPASGGTQGHAALVHVDVRWSFAIAAVWLVVSLVRAVKLVISAVRLRGIWKRAVPVEGCEEILSAAGFRGVQLCTSKDVDQPSVIGFFSPRILIPEDLFARLTTVEFGQIVLHEVGHLRRRDDWIDLMQKVCLILIPLNPVLMWIERRLCLERELACDDDVLRMTKSPKAYATCLTNLAEHRLGRRSLALSLGAWGRQPELVRRVQSILRGAQGMGRTQARVVMGALILGLLVGSAELARAPQFVSFSRETSSASVSAQSLAEPQSLGYQAVAFHPSASAQTGAHATLLKASMPAGPAALPVNETAPKLRHAGHPKTTHPQTSQRTRENRAELRRPGQWVMLTSWDERGGQRMVFAVTEVRQISTSYAAVPTAGGWLVIQL
jgi:beta-lactamase regulating signal transducer with metallopeptidase domain